MLEHLPPGTIVEVDDLLMKGRKLGLVDDTGVGYYDIHDSGEIPKPLHTDLKPMGLGHIAEWPMMLEQAQAEEFTAAWEYLTNRGLDILTLARALRWGMANNAFDSETLLKMGRAATETVLEGRKALTQAAGSGVS